MTGEQHLFVDIGQDVKKKLKIYCIKNDLSMGKLVRELIVTFLKNK